MENGAAIDKHELATRLKQARQERGLTQEEVAGRVTGHDLNKGFIAALENGIYGFRSDDAFPKVDAICKHLGIEVPWVTPQTRKKKAVVVATGISEIEQRIEDAEVTAIYICNKALSRLSEPGSAKRVLDYLRERHLEGEI